MLLFVAGSNVTPILQVKVVLVLLLVVVSLEIKVVQSWVVLLILLVRLLFSMLSLLV